MELRGMKDKMQEIEQKKSMAEENDTLRNKIKDLKEQLSNNSVLNNIENK